MAAFEDLSLLRTFVRIVESGSISAAARLTKTPQPTLSRHLRTLEENCGGALLRRDTHRMSLTEAGHRVLADALAMLALADEAEQRLRQSQTALSGHLRLFATIDSGQFIVTRLISSFLQIHPKVTAELGYTNRPLHMIQEGCDVGIITGEIVDDSVIARPIGEILRYPVAAPSLVQSRSPVNAPADLQDWPWLSLSGTHFGGSQEVILQRGKEAEEILPISPLFISEGVISLREAVRTGLGVCLLPDWLIREDLATGRLIRVLSPWTAKAFPMHVVYAGHRMLPARTRAFIDFAVAYLRAELQAHSAHED